MAYISRSMAATEKEVLAYTWAFAHLLDYLIATEFHIQMDHKPVVSLFSSKHLAKTFTESTEIQDAYDPVQVHNQPLPREGPDHC